MNPRKIISNYEDKVVKTCNMCLKDEKDIGEKLYKDHNQVLNQLREWVLGKESKYPEAMKDIKEPDIMQFFRNGYNKALEDIAKELK